MPRRLCNVTLLAAAGRADAKKIRSLSLVLILNDHVTWTAEFLGLAFDLHLFIIGFLELCGQGS